ncbi:MAG: thioredoxin fold domain-containing protein [Anaerolineae bacterium]|nr:thioredoxin fold domain-containing protein [Anaerolineae bacterium]
MKTLLALMLFAIAEGAIADENLDSVRSEVQKALPNTPIDDVSTSPSNGLFTITSGKNVFYYDPIAKVIFFGEFYSITGTPITETHTTDALNNLINKYEKDAVVINIGSNISHTIYEFVSPNCGYCQKYEEFISKYHNVKRVVFFVTGGVASGNERLNQVLCSPAPVQDLSLLYTKSPSIKSVCEEGKRKLKAHGELVGKLGVVGTPTLYIDGTRIDGFKEQQIVSILNQ